MTIQIPRELILGLALGATVWTGQVRAEPRPVSPAAFNGERLAARHCGGCHAIGSGPSPLADAPPFANLHRRYFEGGLDTILAEGMLAPREPPEEGSPRTHPRMPMARLDDDEVADLKAYLESLDPRKAKKRDCYVTRGRRGDCQKVVKP